MWKTVLAGGFVAVSAGSPKMDMVDCFDGNNGGCSHYCNSGMCECPACWEMQENSYKLDFSGDFFIAF